LKTGSPSNNALPARRSSASSVVPPLASSGTPCGFDHIIPINSSELQLLWAVFNQMKGETSQDEFDTLIIQLSGWLGIPFDKTKVLFEYWSRNKVNKALKAAARPHRGPPLRREADRQLHHLRRQIPPQLGLLPQMPPVFPGRA
jgi:hypothetical protein